MAGITYETVFIAEPEISAEQADQLINKIKQTITENKGIVESEDRWGRRRLAYSIRGFREGFYTVINFTAEASVVVALEHLYNVTDTILRQLTVRRYKSNKKFAPRRERPAGAESHRPGERARGPARTREFVVRPPAAVPTPAAAAVPAAETTPPPEGGKTA